MSPITEPVLGIIAPHPPIMVPEVGRSRADVTADSARAMTAARRLLDAYAPDTIVLMSPHAPLARGAFVIDTSARTVGSLADFGAPEVRIDAPGDPELAYAIIDAASSAGVPIVERKETPLLEPGRLDHGALVPLSFLDRGGRYALVELSLSFLPLATHRALGAAIAAAARSTGKRVAFLASGDCSHRLTPDAPAGFDPRGAEFDAIVRTSLERGDYDSLSRIDPDLIEAAGECGLRSFVALGGFLEGTDARTDVLAYEGPWGVGYLTAVAGTAELLDREDTPSRAHKGGMPGADETEPVALARSAINMYVRSRKVLQPPSPTGLLATRHGAFVSLHRRGQLRGCIGTIAPTEETLADEIVRNAIQAATADPRFPALQPDELDDLDISVDVLQAPEPAAMADLDPRVFGVIVSCDWRRGLLLPDLEGVDSADDQVSIAMRKAGIEPGERVQLERFRVDRYH